MAKSTKHIDQAKVKKREEVKEHLRLALECGNEEDFVALLKELKPDIRPEELVDRIEQFRSIRRGRQRGA